MIKKSMSKRIFILICLLIFASCMLIFAGCGNNGTTQQKDNAENITGEQQTPQAKANDKVYKVGDVIQVNDDTKLTVNEVTKSSGGEFDKPKDGYEYVIVKITIENTGSSNISYNPFDFTMQNSQGQISDIALTTVDQDTSLPSGKLAPGGKVTGTIPFEQPINDPLLQLQYKPDYFSDEVTKINLQ